MTESMASPSPPCVIYLRVSTEDQAQRDFTEEGFSLPAQRETCLQHVREQGWTVIDEFIDRYSASKRSSDRPQFKAMIQRILDVGDVEVVVVHKLDRFARDAAHHLAVRAALRQRGVRLVSIQEQFEETASGRLVDGIHALMAEFYSANLSAEVKKGMKQKVEMGSWTHRAPLGYLNVREWAGGRRVSYVVTDPERADLIRLAFEVYASGEYTLEALLDELRAGGLTNRGRKDHAAMPITIHGVTWLLTNRFYTGLVEWQGVDYNGLHEPLVDSKTFLKV